MKATNHLGKKRSGVILSAFLALCILLVGCAKDETINPTPPPIPVDTTLKLSCNGTPVLGTYSVQMNEGESCNIKWNNGGKNMTILRDDKFFSNQSKGDTTFVVEKTTTFKFLDAFGKELPQKIGITVKTEIVLPRIISFTASSYSIVIGDSVTLTLVYSNGDTNIITSSPIATLKSVSTDSVRHLKDKPIVSTKYSALVWNIFGTDTLSLTVIVTDPIPPTPLQNLQSGKWYLKVLKIDGSNITIPLCQRDDYKIFFPNMWFEEHRNTIQCNPGEDELFGNGSYTLSMVNDTLRLEYNGFSRDVPLLNQDTLKISYRLLCTLPNCINTYTLYEYEYTHQYP